jgi:hypothetical protein
MQCGLRFIAANVARVIHIVGTSPKSVNTIVWIIFPLRKFWDLRCLKSFSRVSENLGFVNNKNCHGVVIEAGVGSQAEQCFARNCWDLNFATAVEVSGLKSAWKVVSCLPESRNRYGDCAGNIAIPLLGR